jgi:hypothetical protein
MSHAPVAAAHDGRVALGPELWTHAAIMLASVLSRSRQITRRLARYGIDQIIRSLLRGIQDPEGVAERRSGLLPGRIDKLREGPLAGHRG